MISNFMADRYLWMFKSLRKSNRNCYTTIPVFTEMDRIFFNHQYLTTGRSLILKENLKTVNHWSMDSLKSRLIDTEIEILNHRSKYAEPDKFKIELKTKTSLFAYIDKLNSIDSSNDFYSVPFNKNEKSFEFLINDILPIDILESLHISNSFIWLGPKGTITPWHYDLQNILMGQLIGKKRVLLIPNWDFPLINNNYKTFGNINYVSSIKNPTLDEPQIFDITLNEGDLLFIPVGWAHYVEGLEKSLTLSFTGLSYDNNYFSFFNEEL